MNNRAVWATIILIILVIGAVGCSSDEEKKIAHFEKGKNYFDKGEFKSAELEYRNAIQIDPQYVEAYERLGETYLRLGDPRSAFREYTMVAKIDPENINARLKLATFNMLSKNLEKLPDNATIHFHLGAALLKKAIKFGPNKRWKKRWR